MSDSASSESSTGAPGGDGGPGDFFFNVGIDLVEVTRVDQTIYLAPELRWGGAGHEEGLYGAPLDRLFGEEIASFVTGDIDPEDIAAAVDSAGPLSQDPLVAIMGLADGLALPWPDEAPLQVGSLDHHAHISADTLHTAEFVTLFDFGPDSHAGLLHLHEAWTWDLDKGSWVFDHHA